MARNPRILKAQVVIPLLTFSAGFFVGWALVQHVIPPVSALITDSGIRIKGKYALVSPLLLCSTTEDKNFNQYQTLQTKIDKIITAAQQAGNATDVSVYFRDFAGHWVGINDTERYAPASLLKVPIMIAYYKAAESDPGLLSSKLTYDGSTDANQAEEIKSSGYIKPGSYTIDDLLRAMIVYSDNNAARLLFNNLNTDSLNEVYTDLGLSITPGGSATAENITAKEYSYFFRILYNATYLTPADSEKALEMLTAADFPQGIPSTVPAGVKVAQKFGERSVFDQNKQLIQRELHDCGIVYGPNNNYLLCIMTRGKDFDTLTGVIQEIGKIVYSEVAAN